MRTDLQAVPDTLDELDATLTGMRSSWREPGEIHGRATGGCKPGCDHSPDNPSCVEGAGLAVNLAAGRAAHRIRTVLHGWARVWDEEHPVPAGPWPQGPTCPWSPCGHASCHEIAFGPTRGPIRDRALATPRGQALLLADQPLAGLPWAPDLAGELHDAIRRAEQVIYPGPEPQLAGTCPCGVAVYAVPGTGSVRCRGCGTVHNPARLYDEMLEARGHLHAAPAAVIARLLVDQVTGRPLVTAAQIRGWRHRGDLAVAETNRAGQPCYSIADVARLARQGAPTTEESCPS